MDKLQDKLLNYNPNNSTKPRKINEVLFYGSDNKETAEEMGLTNLFCIYYLICHANYTIDVCVPSLVSDTVAKSLAAAVKNSGVKVRVAIHRSDNFSNLQMLSSHGIEVKVINSERLQHDFLLIDVVEDSHEAVALIGALDYSIAEVNCNNASTMITSEEPVVKTLKQEFERVWQTVPIEHYKFDNVTK